MQKKGFITGIFILLSGLAIAQYNPDKVNKKAAQLYSKAMQIAEDGNLKESIQVLHNAVKIDNRFADAYLSIAGMHGELKEYDAAIEYYEKAFAIDAEYGKDYNLPYSINLAGKGSFEKALQAIDVFLSTPNLNPTSRKAGEFRKKCYQFALDYAKENPVGNYQFAPVNMGDSINTNMLEYYPTLTIDGKQLIFTRRVKNIDEDFFESSLADGKWSKSKLLPGNINSNMNEGAQTISQDGQMLIFTGCNIPNGYGSCDLYVSYLTADGWSMPENLGGNVNTENWESAPSLSPDKRDLYFASKRPDGYGGSDIYVCHRLPNGKWSTPENLGPTVNTSGDEGCPFIHADNQTLYFTSNGHQGYGGDDLFMVRKGPKGIWSAVKNLGYPINTIENEGSLVISADGKTAFYASDRSDSRGGLDIYTFEMRSDVRPVKTLWVRGNVHDIKTKKGLPSSVELTDLTTKQVISKLQTDETGNYLVTLPVGRDYAFNVNRRGYLFFSQNFPLSQKAPDSTYNIDIPLQPLEANASIILHNIFFDNNSTVLKPESQVELDNVVQLLKDNPTLQIKITGHTDNVGKPADNLTLSQGRAQSVIQYITGKGIEVKRLMAEGLGETQPIAPNNTEEGRAQNRRTELKVVHQ